MQPPVTSCTPMPQQADDPLLNQAELAQALRVSIATARRWRKRRTGPAWVCLPTGQVRYRKSAVDAFLIAREAT